VAASVVSDLRSLTDGYIQYVYIIIHYDAVYSTNLQMSLTSLKTRVMGLSESEDLVILA